MEVGQHIIVIFATVVGPTKMLSFVCERCLEAIPSFRCGVSIKSQSYLLMARPDNEDAGA